MYPFESTQTEFTVAGIYPYMFNFLSYKPQQDRNIFKWLKLESAFIKLIYPKK